MQDTLVAVLVIGLRAVVPLAIFRFPLPAVLASLVVDAADQTLFDAFGSEPASYEAYDKAMDTYYLSLAYLSTLRNWESVPAVRVARTLFLVRLAGVVAFELHPWPPLLLLAPNTFEYFFIAYEAVRTRWDPVRVRTRTWVAAAALLWVVVKLPQEWWLHVAHLDVTVESSHHPAPAAAVAVAVVLLLGAALATRRRWLPPPGHPFRWAADPPPAAVDDPGEQAAWRAHHARLWTWPLAEKVALTTMLVVVFGQVLPGTTATETQLLVGSVAVAVAASAITLAGARRGWRSRSWAVPVLVRAALNAALAAGVELLAAPFGAEVDTTHLLAFLGLLTVVGAAHDRYFPVYDYRVRCAGHRSP